MVVFIFHITFFISHFSWKTAVRKSSYPKREVSEEKPYGIVGLSVSDIRAPRRLEPSSLRNAVILSRPTARRQRGMPVAKSSPRRHGMKKLIATLISLIVLSIAALPVAAQTRGRCANRSTNNVRSVSSYDSRYDRNVNRGGYRNDSYRNGVTYNNDTYSNDAYSNDTYYGQNRSVWNQHRDKITTAGGAVGGALLGGLIGGKKGAVIGAITGGAGAAIYTYKVRDRNRRY